jgi:hypothetical protein
MGVVRMRPPLPLLLLLPLLEVRDDGRLPRLVLPLVGAAEVGLVRVCLGGVERGM